MSGSLRRCAKSQARVLAFFPDPIDFGSGNYKHQQNTRASDEASQGTMERLQHHEHFLVSFPAEHIIQVTLNRPEKLNCINKATSHEIAQIWDLLDNDENLRAGIITGAGRAFCTGADLEGSCHWILSKETNN